MKKNSLKSKKLQQNKNQNPKISNFFTKQLNINNSSLAGSSVQKTDGINDHAGVNPNTSVTVIDDDSTDIIPRTPDVQLSKWFNSKNSRASNQSNGKVLTIITNIDDVQMRKRKYCDSVSEKCASHINGNDIENQEVVDSSPTHRPTKKYNINVPDKTPDLTEEKLSCTVQSKINVITPDKLFAGYSSNFVAGECDKKFVNKMRLNGNIKNIVSSSKMSIETIDIPNKNSPGKTVKTPSKRTPIKIPNKRSSEKTPAKSKKTPTKLFDTSPNINEFKVEVIENFVKITPSKSNKRDTEKISTPQRSNGKKQCSILNYISPSKSARSVEAQQANESTPVKTPCKEVLPSASKAKVKLDFNFATSSKTNDITIAKDLLQTKTSSGGESILFKDSNDLLNDSWEDFTISSQEEYLLDLGEMQHCKVNDIIRGTNQISLVLESTKSKGKAKCILQGFWINTKVDVGCTVYISAVKDTTDWKLTNEHGLLVYEPDMLISSTSVVGALFCKRKSVFNERFMGFEPENKAMIVGILVHTLLQRALKTKATKFDQIEKILKEILAARDTIASMYSSSLSLEDLMQELLGFIPKIVTFMKQYIQDNRTQVIDKQDWKGKIDSVQDIEENIWCPELGIKGKVDVSISSNGNIMPLELKSGRASMSLEHRGQVMLYIMMMSKLGYKVSSGLLLYLREGVLREIPHNEREKRDLILLRNDLAYYLTRRTKIREEKNDTNPAATNHLLGKTDQNMYSLESPELPDPINHHSACAKCPYNVICCSYLRHENADLTKYKPLEAVRDDVTLHLSSTHLQYFVHWTNLLDLESSETSGKSIRIIYTQSPQEREKHGRCITFVKITDSNIDGDGFYKQTFEKVDANNTINFLTSGIGESNYVVISTDTRPALAAGFVSYMDHKSISVALDRDLTGRYSGCTFHIDSYDSNSIHCFNFTNLSLLLEPTEKAEHLRKLIIDREPPSFLTKLPNIVKTKAIPILRRLNRAQQRAALKVLLANDYLLIKGMPGTGKTATIVAIVQLLLELDQTVLITSHTHSAVDNMCIRLKERGVDILRLGPDARIHPNMRSMSEYARTKDCNSPEELEKVYSSAKVLAVTCLGSKHPALTKRIMDVCIVDESTQVLQCSIFRALTASRKFILIGDPDQLPPVVRNQDALSRGLSESLFERLQCPEATFTLDYNYRMNQTITALANDLTYKGQLLIANDTVANATLRIIKLECFLSLHKDQQWIIQTLDNALSSAVKILDTGPTWNRQLNFSWMKTVSTNGLNEKDISSCTNPSETAVVITLVNALLKADVPASTIGVIAPYRAQVAQISSLLQSKGVDVSTVDQFQGQDKDLIIYSCTKSKDLSKNHFISKFDILEDKRRLTVAVTRAKHKFILVGDVATIRLYSPFSQLLEAANSHYFLKLKDGELGFSWNSIMNLNHS